MTVSELIVSPQKHDTEDGGVLPPTKNAHERGKTEISVTETLCFPGIKGEQFISSFGFWHTFFTVHEIAIFFVNNMFFKFENFTFLCRSNILNNHKMTIIYSIYHDFFKFYSVATTH